MKRKALAITLAAVMAMGTCAVTASAADGDKYTIGICQLVQHEALDAATQGFKDEVTKELGEDAVTFDEQNAQGDSNTCSTIINSFVSNNVDLILANATPARCVSVTIIFIILRPLFIIFLILYQKLHSSFSRHRPGQSKSFGQQGDEFFPRKF